MDKKVDTFEKVCEKLSKDPKDYTVQPEWDVHEKYAMGTKRLLLIHKLFQGEKKADYKVKDQNKWIPIFVRVYDDSGRLSGFRFGFSLFTLANASSLLGPLLNLPTGEICDFVGTTFLEEFNSVLMLENEL